jgi:hypothetical protein
MDAVPGDRFFVKVVSVLVGADLLAAPLLDWWPRAGGRRRLAEMGATPGGGTVAPQPQERRHASPGERSCRFPLCEEPMCVKGALLIPVLSLEWHPTPCLHTAIISSAVVASQRLFGCHIAHVAKPTHEPEHMW